MPVVGAQDRNLQTLGFWAKELKMGAGEARWLSSEYTTVQTAQVHTVRIDIRPYTKNIKCPN